jgi:predicted phosphohydrolase
LFSVAILGLAYEGKRGETKYIIRENHDYFGCMKRISESV